MARSHKAPRARSELKNTAYEIFIGMLSILSIVNLVLLYAVSGDSSTQLVLSVMNALFSGIFLGDFIYRIATAPSAGHYFFRGFGWADLLASLPFAQLKILRLFRILRVVRLMRELGPRTIWNTLIHDRANSTLMTLLLMGVLVLQFGSLGILSVEQYADGANITTASDALWYTIVTISTVGYGDQYPVTTAGRLIGALIIVVGVGIFGTFTGYLANLFLGPQKSLTGGGSEATPGDASDEDEETRDAATRDASNIARAAGAGSDPTGIAAAAAAGVAGGAAAGAVSAGWAAADSAALDTAARLQSLLVQSEQALAEMRRILAAPGAKGDAK